MAKPLAFHPIADAFPLMEGDEFKRFADDVEISKLAEPIVLYEAKILDGRNRYLACLDRDVEPSFTEYEGDDPCGFIISKNLHRRHLDQGQRAMAAARLANLGHGGSRIKSAIADLTREQAAELFHVSTDSIDRAKAVLESGSVAVQEAVESGEVKVSDAAAIVDLPKAEQNKALKKVEQGEARTLREATGKKHEGEATRDAASARLARQQANGQAVPTSPDAAKEMVDELGAAVPEHLAEVFAAEFGVLLNAHSQCLKKARELASGPGGTRFQENLQRYEIDLKNARRIARFDAPHCVCRVCSGIVRGRKQNCPCKGTGWLTEAEYGQLPTEYRA